MPLRPEIVNDVIEATRVVSHYNKPMEELRENLIQAFVGVAAHETAVRAHVLAGGGIWEGLAKAAPRLADGIHDFVYQISNPHNSIIKREQMKDQVIKDLFML